MVIEENGGTPPQASRHVESLAPIIKTAPRNDFGLVVGINHYPRFRSLCGAIEDAERFHQWLVAPHGGHVPRENTKLVVSKPDPISPAQEHIDEELDEILRRADTDDKDGARRLYFHFSGHGASSYEAGNDVALLLARWCHSLARIALSKDKYSTALAGMWLFEEVVLLLDCCRTPAQCAVGVAPLITRQPTRRRPTKFFVAYATEPGGTAREERDGKVWKGVFTTCLLEILNRSRGITAEDLRRELLCDLEAKGQPASVVSDLNKDSRFGCPGPLPLLIVEFVKARGKVRLLDGARTEVGSWHVDRGSWQLPLRAGFYKLEDEALHEKLFDHSGKAETNGDVVNRIAF